MTCRSPGMEGGSEFCYDSGEMWSFMRIFVLSFACVALCSGPGESQSAPATDGAAARRQEVREVAETLGSSEPLPPAAVKGWRPARTPWGDPDLQGTFTNNDERLIPFERPAEFDGRRLEDITPQELRAVSEARMAAQIERLATEAPRDPGTYAWFEAWNARNSRAWLVTDPADGRLPQRREQPRPSRPPDRFFPPAADTLYTRCISRGLPGSMMPEFYGSVYEIHQAPGVVAIRYEQIHETRVIPLDRRPHVGHAIRTYMGDARGWWEGDTLVVETTGFKDESAFRGANGATLRLIERFSPIGPTVVAWSVTVDDPSTWVQPWTFAMNLTRAASGQRLYEYACHEGNYGLRYILEAARAR